MYKLSSVQAMFMISVVISSIVDPPIKKGIDELNAEHESRKENEKLILIRVEWDHKIRKTNENMRVGGNWNFPK